MIANCKVAGIKEALEKSVQDLKNIQSPQNGRFGYDGRGNGSIGMTGAGVLCLQLLGYGTLPETQKGLRALLDYKPTWETEAGFALYGLYYITQAKFQESDASFKAWNIIFAPMYCKSQNADGSWPSPPKSAEGGQGSVYTTTMAALTLQVYYRFLPTYKSGESVDAGAGAGGAKTNVEDVVVKIL